MYFVYLITLAIFFFHLLTWLKGKTTLFSKNKLNIPLLIFFSTQLISTFFSVDIHTSLFGYYSRLNGGLLSLAAFSILFLILPQYLNPKFINKLINSILVSGLLVSSYGILEHFGIDKHLWVQDVQSRVFSTLGQPNWLAAYLCILLPFAINKFLNSKSKFQSTIYFLLITNYYLCLLFTKSKSGILAAIVSIAIYFGIYFYKNIFKNKNNQIEKEISSLTKWGWGVLLIISIFIILSLTISNPIKDIIFPQKIVPPIPQTNTINITPSEDIRKIVWTGSIDLWKRYPLFGTGPETFAYTYYWTRPAAHNLTSEWDFLYNKAHNEYLNYLATTGTLGFIAYIFFILSIIYLIIKNIFPSQINNNFYIAILASFISILITNFAGFSVVITSLFFFLLPLFTLLESSLKTDQKPKSKFYFFILIPIFLFLISKIFSFIIADISYNQSQAYLSKQQLATAKQFINLSIYLRPKEAIYHSLAASIASKNDQVALAVNHSNISLSLSPASTNLWKERAQLFSELSTKDPAYFVYAIDALEKSSRLAPSDAKIFYLLGKFYEAASKNDEATKNYLHALLLKPNYDHASFALGERYFNDKNYNEAKKYFEITLKYAPTNPDAKNYLDKIEKLLVK